MPPVNDAAGSSHQSASQELLLVVDAGGTKTAAWLVDPAEDENEQVLGRGSAAAGNPLSVGFPQATRAIAQAVAAAKHQARHSATRIPRAILSIAGSANHQLRDYFVQSARETALAERIAVVSDVLPVLAAGAPDCRGVALIAGTGSVAFARDGDGRTTLCGGWGYLLGDEGSGYVIGRAALQFALQELESNATPRPLSTAALKAIGANTVLDVTKSIYRRADPRSAIASVAPVVIAAADENDPDAQAIVDRAAADLATLVARAVQSIGFAAAPFPLAVAGSVLVRSHRLPQQLQVELRRVGLAADLSVVDQPLKGCVRLAIPECGGDLITWHDV